MKNRLHIQWRVLLAILASGMAGAATHGAVTVLGTQYQQDNPYTEYQCLWHDSNYPTSCGSVVAGSNVHVYLKNTGASSVSISDVTLAGYSLATVIKRSSTYHDANSIYFYWDNPPQAILDAGEPVWFKADPSTIPAGGVAQVVVRLRHIPVTQPVSIGVVTSAGTVNATIPVSASAPQLASVGFSQDRTKVYMHWRRSGGAAPSAVWTDGTNITANTATVGDSTVDFAESVLTLGTPLTEGSYHVYQGVYSDGATATASLRTWTHNFIHATWYTFDIGDSDTAGAQAWIDDCTNRGVNAVENQMSGGLTHFLATSSGRAYAEARGYGAIAWQAPVSYTPLMWFLDDEPDGEEDTMDCGTGLKLPCGSGHDTGILVMRNLDVAANFRTYNSIIPTTVNMDGTLKPDNYYSYGQAVDCLQVDPYYQARLRDTHYFYPERWPLYSKATYIYAVSQAVKTAAEPNPSHVILFSTRSTNANELWPYPTRESKRIEFYYALAGGAKGISYWWFKTPNGLGTKTPEALALWDEIGLLGNEAKAISAQLVTSHPVNMTLAPSTNVWARALASGTDTIILLVVNDNYYNDISGCHYTPVSNATVTATLPSWMQSPTPTAFRISPSGLSTVDTQLNGNQLQLSLGTLNLTQMIVVTTNPTLRATIQQHYQDNVWPGVCAFAPAYCVPQNTPASITQHPSNQTVGQGGSTAFTVVAAGSAPLGYQWQKNSSNLANGGHYSGCTTATLTVSSADSNDVASYRCVVTNPYGNATSNGASLTLGAASGPSITQQPSNQSVVPGGATSFAITATGSAPLSYQWQKNQSNLADGGHYSGATTPTLTITNADGNDAASYRCVVTNPYGNDTSNEVTLTVTTCSAAVLLNSNFEGGNTGGIATNWTGYTRPNVPSTVVYTIQNASPAEGLQYQQIQTSYVATGGAGVYQVMTGCTIGVTYTISGSMRTNSANGRATVKCAPSGSTSYTTAIDLTPAATTTSNTWITFSGTVTATATSMTLFLDCQTLSGSTAKAAAFDGIVVAGCSTPAPPVITQHPVVQNICESGNATFTVAATGSGTLTYQWQKNTANLTNAGHYSGATTSILTITGADVGDVAGYRCVVSNNGGSTNSNSANLTLKTATTINQHPVPQSVSDGSTASFSMTATGDGTLSYQWEKDTLNITDGGHYSGATTATLTITGVDETDAAHYRCVVTGGCGSATSNEAALTIGPPGIPGDFDNDGDVDLIDFGHLQTCFDPAGTPLLNSNCADANLDNDSTGRISQSDLEVFLGCMTGPNVAGNPTCAN